MVHCFAPPSPLPTLPPPKRLRPPPPLPYPLPYPQILGVDVNPCRADPVRIRIRTGDGSEVALTLGDVATKLLLDPALTLRVLMQVGEWVKQRQAAVAGGFQPGGGMERGLDRHG